MRKFDTVFKEKLTESEKNHETRVITEFKKIYNALLEHYNLTAINHLNEKSQLSFLTELNYYWTEEQGLNEAGKQFLEKRSFRLTENSTPLQKKNYLKSKTVILINETLRQNDVKYKIYSIIDEMYTQIKGSSVNDILSSDMIMAIINEAFNGSIEQFLNTMKNEINESAKETKPKAKPINESTVKRVFIRKT